MLPSQLVFLGKMKIKSLNLEESFIVKHGKGEGRALVQITHQPPLPPLEKKKNEYKTVLFIIIYGNLNIRFHAMATHCWHIVLFGGLYSFVVLRLALAVYTGGYYVCYTRGHRKHGSIDSPYSSPFGLVARFFFFYFRFCVWAVRVWIPVVFGGSLSLSSRRLWTNKIKYKSYKCNLSFLYGRSRMIILYRLYGHRHCCHYTDGRQRRGTRRNVLTSDSKSFTNKRLRICEICM